MIEAKGMNATEVQVIEDTEAESIAEIEDTEAESIAEIEAIDTIVLHHDRHAAIGHLGSYGDRKNESGASNVTWPKRKDLLSMNLE